jgi:nucleotide-binding universal stress UspA family protein
MQLVMPQGGMTMIPKINKILYTTDLSQNSAYVFHYAFNSAEMHNAKIDILHVLQNVTFPSPEFSTVIDQEEEKTIRLEEIKKSLDDFVQQELKDNPSRINRISSIQVVEGSPTVRILQMANELKPDIVIMGTHSKGIIAQTFLGSVATNVLQRIKIPVFIIPLAKE